MTLTVGSLCSGILGLDLAVERHFGAELAWCAEINPAASQVITARTTVTNFGDFRDVTPPAVEILCAGFPCQPVSVAGRRAGINDERWLFDDICDLLGRLDPPPRRLVVENVRGLLAANGGAAMARVVEGLARCGYVGSWRTVRASDVGACHRRERVFIVARHASGTVGRGPQLELLGSRVGAAELREPDRAAAADAERVNAERRRASRDVAGAQDDARHEGRGRDTCRDAARDRSAVATHADDVGRERSREPRDWGTGSTHHNFGSYTPAVERWGHILGRPAPAPVDERGRLSAPFVEWMMGYPEGWATDILDRRTDALRCLGNAVVPQQAARALALLSGAA